MTKVFTGILPFLAIHVFCCGTLLFFLISSGYLLVLSNEGRNKIFLLPILILLGFLIWYYRRHGKCCQNKGYKSLSDHILSIFLYFAFSFLLGIAFIIYIFIPWWIPNYQGGMLLP